MQIGKCADQGFPKARIKRVTHCKNLNKEQNSLINLDSKTG